MYLHYTFLKYNFICREILKFKILKWTFPHLQNITLTWKREIYLIFFFITSEEAQAVSSQIGDDEYRETLETYISDHSIELPWSHRVEKNITETELMKTEFYAAFIL